MGDRSQQRHIQPQDRHKLHERYPRWLCKPVKSGHHEAQLCYVLGIAAEAIFALYPVVVSALGKIIAGFDLLEQITRMEVSISGPHGPIRAVR